MEEYKKRLSSILAETGALFFGRDLILKDGMVKAVILSTWVDSVVADYYSN